MNSDYARGYHSCVVYLDKLYIIGSVKHKYDMDGKRLPFPKNKAYCSTGDILVYDIKIETWCTHYSKGCSLGFLENTAVFLNNNFLYLFSGWSGAEYLRNMHRLDLSKMIWNVVDVDGKVPSPRAGHTFSKIDHNYVLMFGGQGKKPLCENEFEDELYNNQSFYFKCEQMKWTLIDTDESITPSPRAYHACCVVEDSIFLYGGRNKEADILNDLYVFDKESLNWQKISSYPSIPRFRHTLCATENYIICLGGWSAIGKMEEDVFCFDISEKHLQRLTKMKLKRAAHSPVIMDKISVFVFGGEVMDFSGRKLIDELDVFKLNKFCDFCRN